MIGLLLALAALQTPLDDGILVVRQDTAEVARESFRLTQSRITGGEPGWILATTIRYDRSRPVLVLSPMVEVSADTLPATLQYDVADPREPIRILGQRGRGRFTVRFLARAAERAREFPTNSHTVVLDDSVFTLYLFAAWRAGAQPATITAIVPRSLRREQLTVQDLGAAVTTLNRNSATLRHVIVTGGPNELVHLWLDQTGRLMKVEIPSRRVTAERLPAG